jgi:uncharacterized protein YjiS (DUF1127 family)
MTMSLITSRSIPCASPAASKRWSLRFALRVWAERRALARMDVSRLKDLGISPAAAAAEAARPFWDLPHQTGR